MKILLVNKYYYNRGGSETYTFDLANLLESKSHRVIPFSMHHEENLPSEYSKYFMGNVDFANSLNSFNLASAFKVAQRSIYSFEAKQKIEQLIKETKPDLAHLQNINYQITPSILYALKKHNIPIVWTLHDYTLICPNTQFLNNGEVCERCKRRKYYRAVQTRCKKNSLTASLMTCIESYIYKILGTYRFVDKFITPSKFLRDKLIEYGFDANRIVHIPNFLNLQDIDLERTAGSVEQSDKFAYIGRLSSEKGVDTLIRAVSRVKGAKLVIAGDGPMRRELEELGNSVGAGRIEFLGYLQKNEVNSLLERVMFVVVPSKCFENFPYSVLEAFAWGKPVVGSRIGGIPEQIEDGVNGFLFNHNDEIELSEKIQHLLTNRSLIPDMGKRARKKVEEEYSPEMYYKKLIEVYNL